jgi:menaquinone-9 beta-reductase
MTYTNDEILIVGGGPSGSSAAISLLQKGFSKVTLLEKGGKGREKICGDGLNESQQYLESLGVWEKIKKRALNVPGFTILGYGNKENTFLSEQYTLKREETDQILRDKVEELGGTVLYNIEIKKVASGDDGVILTDKEKKEYQGDCLVLATGARIDLARSLGFDYQDLDTATAIRCYAKNEFDVKNYIMWMNERLAPGYGWVFPLPDNLLNIGVGYFEKYKPDTSLKALMDEFLDDAEKYFGKKLELTSRPIGLMLRTGLKQDRLSKNRVLLVGENIHTTYNLTGEGVAGALLSGILAAETLNEVKGKYTENSLKLFDQKITDKTLKTHQTYDYGLNVFNSKFNNYFITNLLSSSKRARNTIQKAIDGKTGFSNSELIKGFFFK